MIDRELLDIHSFKCIEFQYRGELVKAKVDIFYYYKNKKIEIIDVILLETSPKYNEFFTNKIIDEVLKKIPFHKILLLHEHKVKDLKNRKKNEFVFKTSDLKLVEAN